MVLVEGGAGVVDLVVMVVMWVPSTFRVDFDNNSIVV